MQKGKNAVYQTAIDRLSETAEAKASLCEERPFTFFILSMLAGAMIGIGSMFLICTGRDYPAPWNRLIGAAGFPLALMLVIFAGAELFTGNVLCTGLGLWTKKLKLSTFLKLWILCWLGNLLGSLLMAAIFYGTGLAAGEAAGQYISAVWASKTQASFLSLCFRGMLCNALVCFAVWCSKTMKDEIGKIVIIFFCIFVFVACGYEHSIANMSLLGYQLIAGGGNLSGFFYNLFSVTLGNILGAYLFLILPYMAAGGKNS